MPDPLIDRQVLAAVMRLVEREAEAHLAGIDDSRVRPAGEPSRDGGAPVATIRAQRGPNR